MPRLAAFPKGFFDAIVAREMSVFRWIDLAGELELDGIELYPRFLESCESVYLKRVRTEAAARGLAIPMMCDSPDFTRGDPDLRRQEVERTKDMFRVTAELGGSFCRVLSGQARPGLEEDGVIGEGLNDYDRIFGRLASAGYTGWVSIEDGEGPTVEEGMANLRASAAFLRRKLAQHFGGAQERS